jgi:AraC-like DNA-binding protein
VDVVSDVLASVRTGLPLARQENRDGTWQAEFDAFPGAGFHVVLAGTCRFTMAGSASRTLTAGDVVLVPHGAAHVLSDTGPGPAIRTSMLCGAYHLDRSSPHPLLAELPQLIHVPAQIGRHRSLQGAVALLGAEIQEPSTGSDAAIPNLLELLLLFVLRAWAEERPHERWPTALSDPVVASALRMIHHDPARPWSVAELGSHAGMSRAAFARRFTRLVGIPPLAYLTRWRLTLAAAQLRDNDLPLTSIARLSGYTSPYAFANAFKRQHGIAPGRYRQRRRQGDAPD